MMTPGIFACVASGAMANVAGVMPVAEDVDLVVDDQFLREPPRDVRHGGVVLDDQLDLLAGDRGAVLLLIELHAAHDLLADRGELAGQRLDDADLDGVLGRGRACGERSGRDRCQQPVTTCRR